MIRGLLTFLSAASLAFCAGTCALWASSYRTVQAFNWRVGGNWTFVRSALGRVYLHRNVGPDTTTYFEPPRSHFYARPLSASERDEGMYDADTGRSALGFGRYSYRSRDGDGYEVVSVPHAFIAAAFSVLPARAAASFAAQRRRRRRGFPVDAGADAGAS